MHENSHARGKVNMVDVRARGHAVRGSLTCAAQGTKPLSSKLPAHSSKISPEGHVSSPFHAFSCVRRSLSSAVLHLFLISPPRRRTSGSAAVGWLVPLTPRISLIWYVLSSSLALLSLRSFLFIVFSHSHRLRSVFDRYSYHNFQRSKTHLCVYTGGAGTLCNSSTRRLDDF